MKFSISSSRSNRIRELLKGASIPFIDGPAVYDSRTNSCVNIEVPNLVDLQDLQSRIESFRKESTDRDFQETDIGSTTPLMIDFAKQEIVIYDFYMD